MASDNRRPILPSVEDAMARMDALLGQPAQREERPMTGIEKPTVRLDRVFDAPRALVYRAWTDPEHIARWWGPNDFSVPHATLDVRPGGKIRIDMQAPDGTVFPMTGIFREVIPNEKLVFTSYAFLGSPDGEPAAEALSTATFTAEGRKTRVVWEQIITAYKPEFVEAIAGMEEGMKQTLDRLGTHLASTAAG